MASSRIICPHCKSVLKPARPVPDGKRAKCPRCGKVFVAPGLVKEDDERPRKSRTSDRKEKAGIKKAAEPPSIPLKSDDEEERSDGIYSYIPETENVEQEKPDIEYAPDMSIKDLRGPAQAAVVRPSNYLLLIGGIGCLCDLFIIMFMAWPFMFSEYVVDHAEVLGKYYQGKGGKEAQDRLKAPPKERKDLKPEELEVVNEATNAEVIGRVVWMVVYFVVLIYNAITIVGAVKMQNLESRGWGIASSIMTFLPPGSAGISGLISGVFNHTVGALLFDELWMRVFYSVVLGGLVYLLAVIVGVWSLRTLLSQEVIEGFEYVAE